MKTLISILFVLFSNFCLANSSQLDFVTSLNKEINKFEYKDDHYQFGTDDYWQTPREFYSNGGGDCEDFAIAKYAILAKKFGSKRVRLIYGFTIDGISHMVAGIYIDNQLYILDNRVDYVKTIAERNDLSLLYDFNDRYMWVLESGIETIRNKENIKLWNRVKKKLYK